MPVAQAEVFAMQKGHFQQGMAFLYRPLAAGARRTFRRKVEKY
jgi:hypothetical protein